VYCTEEGKVKRRKECKLEKTVGMKTHATTEHEIRKERGREGRQKRGQKLRYKGRKIRKKEDIKTKETRIN
jgi:hypothetical protein